MVVVGPESWAAIYSILANSLYENLWWNKMPLVKTAATIVSLLTYKDAPDATKQHR